MGSGFYTAEDIFLKEVKAQTRVNTITVSLITLLVAVAAIYASRSLTYPITRLTKVTNQFARGNLKARAQVNREDELGALANAFNDTANILQKLIVEIADDLPILYGDPPSWLKLCKT